MEKFREFQGNNLDDCISQALNYFDCSRENLEVELIQDAKNGIFGIVGVRKAKIRARRARLQETVASILSQGENCTAAASLHCSDAQKEQTVKKYAQPGQISKKLDQQNREQPVHAAKTREPRSKSGPDVSPVRRQQANESDDFAAGAQSDMAESVHPGAKKQSASFADKEQQRSQLSERQEKKTYHQQPGQNVPRGQGKQSGQNSQTVQGIRQQPSHERKKPEKHFAASRRSDATQKPQGMHQRYGQGHDFARDSSHGIAVNSAPGREADDNFAPIPLAELDQQRLENFCREIVASLIRPIVGDSFDLTPDFAHAHPRVHIAGDWENGALIGRDGQTLIALEYLASRMLSKAMEAPLRLHLDIGSYRAKQEDKLREMARSMAERVRQTGRSLSTRPLSSYHRRIIHLALHDQPDVMTRSSGDGPLKRVLVFLKRQCPPLQP